MCVRNYVCKWLTESEEKGLIIDSNWMHARLHKNEDLLYYCIRKSKQIKQQNVFITFIDNSIRLYAYFLRYRKIDDERESEKCTYA